MRQIVLDTETTGLDPASGHRIIEIGCVELVNRKLTGNHYHQYIKPEREIDPGAIKVHGVTNEFLADKPLFNEIAADFVAFITGAELIIHNAPFDTAFINHELKSWQNEHAPVEQFCRILDTLALAREKHPGQKNNLDALCKRYNIDNSHREKHGALLDAEILADLYLVMTGGQGALNFSAEDVRSPGKKKRKSKISQISKLDAIPVIYANSDELAAHEMRLQEINKKSAGSCMWLNKESSN